MSRYHKEYQITENNITYDVEETNSYIVYRLNGVRHREFGPAVFVKDGFNDIEKWVQEWIQNDLLHRLDGPAVITEDGSQYWYYNGTQVECQTQEGFERYLKLKMFW